MFFFFLNRRKWISGICALIIKLMRNQIPDVIGYCWSTTIVSTKVKISIIPCVQTHFAAFFGGIKIIGCYLDFLATYEVMKLMCLQLGQINILVDNLKSP